MQIIARNEDIGKWLVLNNDPLIQVIDNFLSAEDCNYLIKKGGAKLTRALVSSASGGEVSSGRTGSNCWLSFEDDSSLKEIALAISSRVNIPLENSENMQLIYYSLGQEYKPHFDAYDLKSDRGIRCTKNGGQRLVTALLYLNDVRKGGGTIFPKLDIIVEAKAGRALVFQNTLLNDSIRHPLSLHGGLPVEEGEKWAVNLWFRQFSTGNNVKNQKHRGNSSKELRGLNYSGDEAHVPSKAVQTDQSIGASLGTAGSFAHAGSALKSPNSNRDGIADVTNNVTKAIDFDQTRYWIAKCLVMGLKEDYIYGVLLEIGLKKQFIKSEIQSAQESSYTKAGQKVFQNFTQMGRMVQQKVPFGLEVDDDNEFLVKSSSEISVDRPDGEKNQFSSCVIAPEYPQQVVEACSNNVLIVPNFIPTQISDFVKQVASAGSFIESKRGKRVNTKAKIRDDYFFQTDECPPLDSYLFSSVVSIAKDYYGCELGFRERWKIGHYAGEKQGFYIPHTDTAGGMQHRIISCVVMLSSPDEYTGGELVFPNHDKELKLSQFSAAIFPSGILHGVKPVLSGTRQTLLSFMWSISNMQIMPKNPIGYLPRVKLNFSNSSLLEKASIIHGDK